MPDVTPEAVAELRRLKDAASPTPWVLFGDPGKWYIGGPSGGNSVEWDDLQYAIAAANLAPALADAYEAAAAETQRVAGLYRELSAAICGPTMQCEDHRILLLEAAKHRGEWQSLCVVAKNAEIATLRAERDAAVAEAVRGERERAADVALRLAKTRFSFSDQPWVCSEIAAAIRRGE